ncbi:MAG: hypothetical protein JSR19_01410 [Proteobacteria bacterium]|nr:hypothetical protein [Pseudomonadota bacterium]HQR02507.1 hypothetical protein [Rhodocyclaceae bacterium]
MTDNWLTALTTWLLGLVQSVFSSLLTFIHDAALWLFDGVLQAIAGLVAAIPVPSFLSSGLNLDGIFSGFPGYAFYLLNQLSIGTAFGIFTAGVMFRLTRKLFTLGQW